MEGLLSGLVDATDEVIGVACNDMNGLCLGAKGEVNRAKSGFLTSIVRRASQLDGNSLDSPMVVIESESSTILVKEYDGLTVAVVRRAAS